MRRFCEVCGTQLTYETAGYPDTVDVTTAALDFPDLHAPSMEVWLEHKLAWQPSNQNLDRYGRGIDSGRES